jgi:uncharacterized membrane protein YjjB (DUF3815 family)
LFGSYASGFGGGLTLTLCAAAMSQRPHAPAAAALLLPGFWLPVPGSLGLVGVTQLVNAQHHRRHHGDSGVDDLDRARRATRSAAVARRSPAG